MATERCTPARRRPVVALSVDVGAQLEEELGGVDAAEMRCRVERAHSIGSRLVHVSSLNDDWYEYRSRQNRLVGRKNRRVYQLGDPVRVNVMKVDVLRNQIDLEVIPVELEEASSLPEEADSPETLVELTPVTLSNP